MSQSLGGLIESWKLPEIDESQLKSWLELEGWDLKEEPDFTIWLLTREDLQAAGIRATAQDMVLSELYP